MDVDDTWAGCQASGSNDTHLSPVLNVPSDAGKYRDALATVLLRMPTGPDNEIACGPGWYKLVAELHKELCSIDVHYVVHTVRRCGNRLHYEAESQSEDPAVQRMFHDAVARARERSANVCPWSGRLLMAAR